MNGQKLEWQDEVLAQLQAGLISLEEAEQRLLNGPGSGSSASDREPQRTTPKAASLPPQRIETGDIAIIGMACRFPDANDWRALWANLKAGVDSIGEAPTGRWPAAEEWYDPDPAHPDTAYVRSGGFIQQVDQFDAPFFKISPAEAELMDPQQRIFLEEAYHAIEDAGLMPEQLKGRKCGVFVGAADGGYGQILAEAGRVKGRYVITGLDPSILAARIAYFLDLQGPAVALNTACSTSLLAIHEACESIRAGEIELALAGGISLYLTPMLHIQTSQFQMLSPDARCKTFDAGANGFVPGEGCGVVLLKQATQALADGDPIHAIIKGSGINQDGSTNGITAPSMRSQARLEKGIYERFQINPATIGYVEAHGTGTALGDPIEINALTESFAAFTQQKQFCAIGSLKTNIGHTLMAAGVAGVIKAALCLKYSELPPSLHFQQPNPHIDFAKTPFYVNIRHQAWPAPSDQPRRAAISSFGMSGTNAHLVLESAPLAPMRSPRLERPVHLLTMSAKSSELLAAYAQRYRDLLAAQPEIDLGDLCYTSHVGRSHFPHRLSFVADSVATLQQQLTAYVTSAEGVGISQGSVSPRPSQVAFLFTGQGAQYVQMGRELYDSSSVFRATIDRCDAIFREVLGRSLLELLYPATPPRHNDLMESHPCGQASNFALECALADLWRSWGVQPNLVLGHSLGDFAAAYCAGVLSLEDGLRLVVERGRLMEEALGSMVSVLASPAEVAPFIAAFEDVTIGVINGPTSVVISGGHEHVAQATVELQQAGFKTRKLDIPVAAHSPMLDPVLDRFEAAVRKAKLSPPNCTVVSSMTGQIVKSELVDPVYWRNHLRNTVRFADGVTTLQKQGCTIFLEVGPKPTLLGMLLGVMQQIEEEETDGKKERATAGNHSSLPVPLASASYLLLPSLRQPQSDWQQMVSSLGELYVRGVAIDWQSFDREHERHKVTLPTYPFQSQRYWVNGAKLRQQRSLRPLIDKMTQSPLLKELLFETEFSLDALPFLADHQVYGTVISPGAGQLAMALNAAALALRRESALQIDDVIWSQPLVIAAEKKQTVQALLRPETHNGQGGHYGVQLVSFAADETIFSETSTNTHLTASVRAGDSRPALVVDLATLRQRCAQSLDVAAFYRQFDAVQIVLGPSFRWVQALWCSQEPSATSSGQEVLAQFACPETIHTSGHLLHPTLLDACLQITGAVRNKKEAAQTLLPFALDSIYLQRTATSNRWWCHATQVGAQRWDIQLLEENGEVVATLRGFSARPAPVEAIQGENLWRNWLYKVAWETQPLPPVATQAKQALAGQHWLLFADQQGVGAALAVQLRQQGATPLLVYANQTLAQPWLQVDSTTYHLHPTQAEQVAALLTEITNHAKLQGVVHLWSLDAPPLEQSADLEAASRLGCGTVLPLAQALVQQGGQTPRLWLVSQGAQAVLPGDSVAGLAQSTLWGLGKVIALEHPELACVCLDLAGTGEQAVDSAAMANQLLAEVSAAQQAETQIAWRDAQRYVARLVRYSGATQTDMRIAMNDSQVAVTHNLDIHKAATYLITGGLGGLGLEVAKWLAAQGAGHLLLLGRSSPTPTAQTQLDELAAQGVRVTVAQADVTDPRQVEQALAQIDPAYPLRGLVHAAGLLDDGALLQQNWARFAKVLPAKVQGTWHLHEATKRLSLDFFVMFSSIASLFGNRGQANYAAANAFLDAFAHYRQAQGLPALSINWGPWGEVGMAAALSQRLHSNSGLELIAPTQGLQQLALLLTQQAAQVGVVPIHWQRYQDSLTDVATASFFSHFLTTPKHSPHLQETLQATLAAAPLNERVELVVAYVQKQVAQVLGFANPATLSINAGLLNLGIDSLMAVELRNRLQRSLGCTLPTTLIFDYPSVEAVATYLAEGVLAPLLTESDEDDFVSAAQANISLAVSDGSLQSAVVQEPKGLTSTIDDSEELSISEVIARLTAKLSMENLNDE